jgi:hypothetical protein
MELITYNASNKVWQGGYRGGAKGKTIEEIQQVLYTLADAAHAQGLGVSQYIWGSPADGCQWADPKTRPAREEFYRELARRYGAKVDHIITHWKDEGNEGGFTTPLPATMFMWKEYQKYNPKMKVTCDAWFNPGIYKGIANETYASRDVAIAIERWYNAARAEEIAKAGRKIGVWGWYLSDFEMTGFSHIYVKTLDKYFSELPTRAGELVDWISLELCFHGLPSEINLFVTGRKMWEPKTPTRDLVLEYCSAVYGPANAEAMRRAYETVEEGQKEVRYGMVAKDKYPVVLGTAEFKAKVDAVLAALETVKLPPAWRPNFAMVGTPQDDIDSLRASLLEFSKATVKTEEAQQAGEVIKRANAVEDELDKAVKEGGRKYDTP